MKKRPKVFVFLLLMLAHLVNAQTAVPYGNNLQAGHYYNVGDAKIYYELYGKGKPIVLLHGGLFGYIDEYEFLIPKLAQTHQVIAIGTRGHGKSEIGTKAFSYQQLADDAFAVIRSITKDSVLVLGFSDGGITGYNLTATHPELVRKLVAIGSPQRSADRVLSVQEEGKMTPERLDKMAPDFVKSRKAIMPDASRWSELLDKLDVLWNQPTFISDAAIRQIKCPVLVMAGDKDPYFKTEKVVETARIFQHGTLSIISGCGHVVLYCNFPAVWEAIVPFINKPSKS
ncbi:alpha/beta fold hydrolase [Spirosoma sp. HMF4905]|uniref:Alpha/beta fold hydrolase n=1 Tax=Spirosoma arboris TaxID=2682092 RepID=A0A7K1SIZ8_9BACT|nr:alpha/beta hydrolase [Spirosoma arboris]MVM33787.1 alpha/beta fold hydrolase [Spirosoma arboris]